MKCRCQRLYAVLIVSPPARGAWIEILRRKRQEKWLRVAPRTGGVD